MMNTLKPLMLLPGLLCDERLWKAQVEGLSDVATTAVVDLTRSDSVEGMARTVLERAPRRFALAGLSMGGYVALEIMRTAPERVERLALLDTTARPDTPEQTQMRLELIRLARSGRFREAAGELLRQWLHPRRLSDRRLTSTVMDMAVTVGPEAFERQERALIARPDSRGDLASIACPTLVLCGREDGIIPPVLHEELAAGIPGARLRVIEDCGHLSSLERPEEVTDALRNWLE